MDPQTEAPNYRLDQGGEGVNEFLVEEIKLWRVSC